MHRTTLILFDSKTNRHSLNALVGALETDRQCDALELRLPTHERQLSQHIAEVLAAGKQPVVGLSFTSPQLWRVGEMRARLAGEETCRGRVLWIAGGPHPSADPAGTLQLGFDVVVRGEGEATLLELLRALAGGGAWQDVAGISFREPTGEICHTGRRPPVDLDAFPPFPLSRRKTSGPIEITRGCPFVCGYCQTSHLLGTRPRHRSVETIARFAHVIRQRNQRDVRVITPNAFSYGSPDGRQLNLPALEALLATLRQTLGPDGRLFFGTFPSEVRPEHVQEATLDLLARYANNTSLVIGAQSGSERMLTDCGRGHGVAEIFSAVSRTLAAGFEPLVDFIFGLPGETREDLQATIEVIRELAAMGAQIHAHTFMPLPQTRFADAPPGRIHGRLRLVIKELTRKGTLFGVWGRQAVEATRLANYLRQGRL